MRAMTAGSGCLTEAARLAGTDVINITVLCLCLCVRAFLAWCVHTWTHCTSSLCASLVTLTVRLMPGM